MNTFTYQMRVRHSEGALVRILGLTRRRRFDVIQFFAQPSPDGDFMDIEMTVRSARQGPTLARQLANLLDVASVGFLVAEKAIAEKAIAPQAASVAC